MYTLERKIIDHITVHGPMTFERFMEMALYDPELGYYMSAHTRIGREGDFYTSSHLHPVFGSMIGRQLREMWQFMGKGKFSVVEMGAGAGYVCRDMLDSLKGGEFFGALDYCIIERNPSMAARQKDLLSDYTGKVTWAASLKELGAVRGCIFTNELLDAFPVHVVLMEDVWKEVYVSYDGSNLVETAGPLSRDAIGEYLKDISCPVGRGYKTEVNLGIRDWLSELEAVLTEGFVFTIDYGYSSREYYSEDRDRGTLICYRGHQLGEEFLKHVGEQDITAHVNFSSLKKWGEDIGLRALGYITQGLFLMSLGIDEEIKKLVGSDDYLFELARIKKLILPQGMGDSHMVMVQYKGCGCPVLGGFRMGNRLRHL